MRKFVLLATSVSALAAVPAAARDGAWYVGGDFGAMIVEDEGFDFAFAGSSPTPTPTPNPSPGPSPSPPPSPAPTPGGTGTVRLNSDLGLDGALFVGYDLGAFRLEAEVAYGRVKLAEFENDEPLHNSSGTLIAPGTHEGGGSTSALSFMINGMLDFGDDDGISGFVGGGAGMARVDYNNIRTFSNDAAILDDSDTRFAWQIVAGVRQAVSRDVDIHLRYRFFNVTDMRLDQPPGGGQVDSRFSAHRISAGLSFSFGGPAPE